MIENNSTHVTSIILSSYYDVLFAGGDGLVKDYFPDGDFVKYLSRDTTQKIFEHFENTAESESIEDCLKKCALLWLNENNSVER